MLYAMARRIETLEARKRKSNEIIINRRLAVADAIAVKLEFAFPKIVRSFNIEI